MKMTMTTTKRRIRITKNNYNSIGHTPSCRSESSQHWAPNTSRPVISSCRDSYRLWFPEYHQPLQKTAGKLRKDVFSIDATGSERFNWDVRLWKRRYLEWKWWKNGLETLDTSYPSCFGSSHGGNRAYRAASIRAFFKQMKMLNRLRI